METLDYIVILIYFLGLIAVSLIMSRKIKNSEDMFIAGRNSSWWLSGISSYMTIFSASTFVVWGGVAYKSGLVAVVVAICLGIASFVVGKWISGKWRQLRIKSPGEFLTVRFGHRSVSFYTISGIVARAVHTAVALYAVAVVMCALIKVPEGSILASTGLAGDSPEGFLSIWWALLILGTIALVYTIAGGFLAVLMTDVIQFGVLFAVVVFMIPLSFNAVGGLNRFIDGAAQIPGFLSGTSPTYTWLWLALWVVLNVSMIGGDWPFVQRYISVPTVKDAKKSTYLIGALYLVTPLIWYLPTMVYRVMEPGLGLELDAAALTYNGEHAYVNMSKMVLMSGMVGMMLAAMLSATLSNVSGILNVYANVYTYEIWGHGEKNRNASERKRIRVGRMFTLIFGLVIIALSMLVPFAGGAEKVVVTLLTMVMCPLYIPSIWGLFSKRLSGNQLIWAMVATWVIGITAKLTVPAQVLSSSLIESISGCVLPVLILAGMEVWSASRGISREGFEKIRQYTDPSAEVEPGPMEKKAVKAYSLMAVDCFCITLGAVVLLLAGLLIAGDPKTLAVKGIVLGFCICIGIVIALYAAYRIIDRNNNKQIPQSHE
ncbi:MAG: sodium:solute symporter family protein [Candidatus Cryptobacteroides sp.]|nr:sodium:solute symporter family protein [Candidatus Cryptobacteroides sp.]